MMTRAGLLVAAILAGCSSTGSGARMMAQDGKATKFVRFEAAGKTSYGVVEGARVRAISGDLFGSWQKTETTFALAEVKLLVPCVAPKVFALAGNYKSHLGTAPQFKNPELFYKLPTCLVPQGADVVIPKGTNDVHFEAELVIVIGKRAKNVSKQDATGVIFGVTCGNDISARDWQKGDRQWWRAKAADTFGPVGPWIVTGINYNDLAVEMRQNGEVRQKARTSELIFDCATVVSFMSEFVTLEPGDLIYTGTPGTTSAIKPGDVLEVEIEGIGVLKNKVTAAP
jgi:2-keto-4-pentenoate hydratase/2-oxohepta-3-ene-1,7-dioic acid hydratase in catechol pathway